METQRHLFLDAAEVGSGLRNGRLFTDPSRHDLKLRLTGECTHLAWAEPD
jgi:hypothetical protein